MKKNLIKFTIIVPVYNTEKYIYECLESLYNQTYCNYEVIIIDDGSNDNSINICNLFLKKDKRFKLLSQDNEGVSSARNKGLSLATGDYVIFVDSDDFVNKNLLIDVLEHVSHDSLISFGYEKKYMNKSIKCVENYKIYKGKEKYNKIIYNKNISGIIANKVFSLKVIKKFNIKFKNDIHYCEDLLFCINYLAVCQKLIAFDKILYYYRMRKGSALFSKPTHKNLSILSSYSYIIDMEMLDLKIKNYLKYQYLINYRKMEKLITTEHLRMDIINDEKKILKKLDINLLGYLKYKFYYCNSYILIICKYIKSLFYKLYN